MAPVGIVHFNEDPAAGILIYEGPLSPPDPQTAILVRGDQGSQPLLPNKAFPLFWRLQKSV